ncbi:GntR family transcriptional regulator [soil metagenome]
MQAEQPIDERIVDAILAGRITPGQRLGEQPLGELFGVSRTRVREALMRLQARGIVEVSARRGWFVVEPSQDEAREAFEARRAVEVGLLCCVGSVREGAVERLKAHIREERRAIASSDVGERSFLLGDFHVCMAESLGNGALAGILRGLTARTVLIAALYQSNFDASGSCTDHENIVAALEAGNLQEAARLMDLHIGSVEAALRKRPAPDPLQVLRDALEPLSTPRPPPQEPSP